MAHAQTETQDQQARMRESQSLLPRPHHMMDFTRYQQSSEYKNMGGYQTDIQHNAHATGGPTQFSQQRTGRTTMGVTNSNYHKSRSTIEESAGKKSY